MAEDSPKDIWGDETLNLSEEEPLVKDEDDLQSAQRFSIQDTENIAETPFDVIEGNNEASYSLDALQPSQSSSMLDAKEDDSSMIIFSTPETTPAFKISPLSVHRKRAQQQEKYRRMPSLSELSRVKRCLKFDDDEIKENKPLGVVQEQGSKQAIDSIDSKSGLDTSRSQAYLTPGNTPDQNEEEQPADIWNWHLELSASINLSEINKETVTSQGEEMQKMLDYPVLEDKEKERKETTNEEVTATDISESFPNMHIQNVPDVNFDNYSEIELPPTQLNPDLFCNESPLYIIEDSEYSSEEEIAPSQVSTRTLTLRDFSAGSSKEVSASNYNFPADQDIAQATDGKKRIFYAHTMDIFGKPVRMIQDETERNLGDVEVGLSELRNHPLLATTPELSEATGINDALELSDQHNLPHIVKLQKSDENRGAAEIFETQELCFLAEAGIELLGSNFEEIPQTSTEEIPQTSTEEIPQSSTEEIPQSSTEEIPQTSTEEIPQISVENTLQTGVEETLQCVVEETLRGGVEDIPHAQVKEIPLTGVKEIPFTGVKEIPQIDVEALQQLTTEMEQFSEINLENFYMLFKDVENFEMSVDDTPTQCPNDEPSSSKIGAIVQVFERMLVKKPSEIIQVKEFPEMDGVKFQTETKDSSGHIQELNICQEQVFMETGDTEKCHSEVIIHPNIQGSTSDKNSEVLEEQKPLPLVISKHEELSMSPKKAEDMTHDKYPNPISSTSERSKQTINNVASPSNIPTPGVGTFSSPSELNIILKSLGLSVDDETLESFSSLPPASGEKVIFSGLAVCKIVARNNTVFQEISALDQGKIIQNISEVEVSPANSSSTTLSTKTCSFGSIPSGDLADISCSISSKSLSSSASSNASQPKIRKSILSQEAQMGLLKIKTSTQKSDAISFKASGAGINEDSQLQINKGKEDELHVDASVSQSKQCIMPTQLDNKKPSQCNFRSAVVVLTRLEDLPSYAQIAQSASTAVKSKRGRKRKLVKSSSVPTTFNSSSSNDKPTKKSRKHSGKLETNYKRLALRSNEDSHVPAKSQEHDKIGKNMESNNCSNRNSFDTVNTNEESGTEPVPYSSIIPGVRVMARWKDGYYYPGTVQRKESGGRWWINFDDGLHSVNEKHLIKISILEPGMDVLARSANDYYECGAVISHFRDGDDCGYVIEHPTGVNKRYLRSDVILSSEQAKVIIESRPAAPSSLTINLDNIVDGKRKRKLVQASDCKSKSSRCEKRKTKADSNLDSTESSVNESVLPQKYIVQKVKVQLKKSGRQQNSKYNLPRNRNQATSSDIGSNLPEKTKAVTDSMSARSNNIFMRYAFLLSSVVRNTDVINYSTSNSGSESNELQDLRQPFNKDTLCRSIIAGGGIVLETFDEAMKSNRTVLLLADGPLRTIKYIQCVSVNLACVKHFWIEDCLTTKSLFPVEDYLLPTGFSLIRNELVEWHGQTGVFAGLQIVLAAEKDSEFSNTWTPVLLAAKANLVKKGSFPTSVVPGMSFEVDLIITNSSCPEEVLRDAQRWNTPIVSSEWMIQCIIAGMRLPYDAHARFQYNAMHKNN